MTQQTLALLGGAHVHLPDHLEHLQARGWRLSHVADRDPARGERLCRDLGAAPLEQKDLTKNLARSGCEGVVICSETVFHEADITAALEAGLPVFVEKPLAGSAEAARRCAELAIARECTLHTGYFLRTNAALRGLHAQIEGGAFGRVIELRLRFAHDGGYADWLDLTGWMTDPALACYGGFADEAVHCIDALQWLLGPIRSAQAVTGNVLGWPVDDHGAGVLTFETGATGVVEAGWTDSEMRLELDLVGEKGWAGLRDGRLETGRRGDPVATATTALSPLDAGAGIEPFLDVLEGRPAPGLVPQLEAAQVNVVLDEMGLRL